MAELRAEGLTIEAGGVRLVDDASLTASAGEIVAVIGENGAGKSSLLRGMVGYFPSSSGTVTVDGSDILMLRPAARARIVGWLPQALPTAWPTRVYDAVALGRYAYGGVPGRLSDTDRAAIDRAICDCALQSLVERDVTHLSGGEQARVHLARTLAGQTPVLLADEPVAALDPRHRLAIMHLLQRTAAAGTAVVVVLHDLSLAARFANRIVALKGGRIVADGAPAQIIDPGIVAALYGVDIAVDTSRGWPEPVVIGATRSAC